MTHFARHLTCALLAGALAVTALPAAARDGGPRGDRGAMFLERFDADGDGAVTRAEVDAFHAGRFESADADGDGALSETEIVAQMETRMTERFARRAARMIERHDANGDGLLSPDEVGDRLGRGFDRLDADDDGTVTAEELETARADFRRHRGPGARGHHGDAD